MVHSEELNCSRGSVDFWEPLRDVSDEPTEDAGQGNVKLPTLPSPLKLFAPAPAGLALGMAGATGGHMMFASSGGGRGGNDYDDDFGFDDDFEAGPVDAPQDEEPPRRPRSTRSMRSGGAATGGQTRVAQHEPEERYWTDYLRIALPVIGLLLMIGLLWFWATQLIGDTPKTTEPVNGGLGLVNEGTPAPTDEPIQGQTTQPGAGSTIGIGNAVSTPASQPQETSPTQPATTGQQAPEPTTDPDTTTDQAGGAQFASGDKVLVTEDGVNVRPDPSVGGDPITMLNAGDELTIASGPVDAEDYVWWEVILPSGDSGWVVEDFIEPAQ